MRLVMAIVQPTKLGAVQSALERLGVEQLTVLDAQGFARQRGQTAAYRGVEYKTNLLRKVVLEIAVDEELLEPTIETLAQAARVGSQGSIGDGKIFVLPALREIDL